MQCTHSRSYLINIVTCETNILNAWNFLVDMLALAEIEFSSEWPLYVDGTSWKEFTITISLLVNREILIKISGFIEKKENTLFLARKILLGIIWEMFPIFLRESHLLIHQRILIRQSLQDSLQWKELN